MKRFESNLIDRYLFIGGLNWSTGLFVDALKELSLKEAKGILEETEFERQLGNVMDQTWHGPSYAAAHTALAESLEKFIAE